MAGGKLQLFGCLVGVVMLAGGCNRGISNGFLDPTQVGNFSGPNRPQNIQNVVSIMDEPLDVATASSPTPEDLVPVYRDYVLGPGDIIDVVIYELFAPDTQTPLRLQLSETGVVSVPELGPVELGGLTALEAEERLKDLLIERRIISRNPRATVQVVDRRHWGFDAIGAFGRPGPYQILRPDFRLLDAVSLAGGVSPDIETIYLIRTYSDEQGEPRTDAAAAPAEATAAEGLPATAPVPQTLPDEAELEAMLPAGTMPAPAGEGAVLTKPIYVNGQWVEVPVAPAPATGAATVPATEAEAELEPGAVEPAEVDDWMAAVQEVGRQRILQIPVKELLQGDPRYNVVIRPDDKVYAWIGPVGVFYIGGNVNVPGVYNLTGEPVTLLRAIIAARGLGPLAWPGRCELIRQYGDDTQEIIHLDLDAIFAGTQPDVLLKPNDVVNIGTHPVTPFLATVRNAFRMTYGFGFVYDRNFADIDAYAARSNPADVRRVRRQNRFGFLFQ